MGSPTGLDDLEYESCEDPMTADLPVDDPATLGEDLGDLAPPGQEHKRVDELDPGIDPVDAIPEQRRRLAPTGLNARDRIRARDLAIQAASLALRNHAAIQYTQDARRWDPIKRNRKAWRGEFGRFQDCSSFATWCLWNGLDHFGISDIVNGQRWQAGFTGTMLDHGQRVARANVLRGDLLFYAKNGTINHVTIYIGGGMVTATARSPAPARSRWITGRSCRSGGTSTRSAEGAALRRVPGLSERRTPRAGAPHRPGLGDGDEFLHRPSSTAAVSVALATTALLLVVAQALYGIGASAAGLGLIAFAVVIGSLVFSCLAYAMASAVPNVDAAQPAIQLTMLPLYFLSGIWFSTDALPEGVRAFARALPVEPLADLVHRGMQHPSLDLRDLAVLAAWAVAGAAIAARRFSWLPKAAAA